MRRVISLWVSLALALLVLPASATASPSQRSVDRRAATVTSERLQEVTRATAKTASAELTAAARAAADEASAGAQTSDTTEDPFCYTNVRSDTAGDMERLDVVLFGAFYSCADGIWVVGAVTDDAWNPDELDYVEFYFDTDDDLNTGCYGDNYSVYGFYDTEDAAWYAGVWSTPTCDPATWSLVDVAGIAYSAADKEVDMAFYETSIGSPDSMWYYGWLENMYSYDVEEIGDGSSYLLSGYHQAATPPAPVALTVTGGLTRSKVALGTSSVLKGSLTPTYDGAVIRLQKLVSGEWKTVATKTLSSGASTFSFSVSPTVSALHYYRVWAPGKTGYTGDTSPKRTLTVYNAAITSISYNPPGKDANNLNGEYAVVKNTGGTGINLANWKLDAGDGKVRTLPSYALAKGATVRLHTGSGTNSSGHIYLKFGSPIWNDTSDTGKLFDPHGTRVSVFRY